MNDLFERITIDPETCHGKPVIRGLRYPVEPMLKFLIAQSKTAADTPLAKVGRAG
jgi:uncharacterized protein (DUF433 family)